MGERERDEYREMRERRERERERNERVREGERTLSRFQK
jgi:hypothetical protein